MNNKMKKLFGIILSLVLVLGVMPGMSLTALAEDPYAGLKNTTTPVKFDDKDWYLINYDNDTVTLLSKECVGASVFGSNNTYSGSTVEGFVNDWYSNSISANAKTAVDGNGAFLLSTDDVSNLSQDVLKCDQHSEAAGNYWWLCSPGIRDVLAKSVNGSDGQVSGTGSHVQSALLGVRPAIKLNLSSVVFESNEFTVIKVDVTGVTLNKTAVTLNANGTETLTATVAPDNATDKAITWSSDNTAVATVSDGVVTAVAEGTANITVTATNGTDNASDDKTATCAVTVETETVATPIFSPEAGTYTEAQSVTITCATEGATIHYTTDGSTPTASSTPYSNAISVSETATIKAIAVKAGMADSAVTSATYTISEAPEKKTKVEVEGLSDSDISDDLKGSGYTSVESIGTALETALSIETEEEKERSKLVDVKLMISTDGGTHWDEATAQNFPAGGIDVVLPYPDGTNGDEYSFSVAHMIGTSANGKTAGEIEKPGTTNTSSGISTHFNGLSPVMITWTKNSSPSKKDDSKSKEKAHTHHYVWETIEATEDSDGELRYKCDICGDIQTRVPITAYYVFNKNTTDKIRKAGQGATVKIETSRFISFHKMVMDALAERPDVTLEISFLDGEYKGNRVTVTIPAGTDALSLLDENGFVGFLYLASKYGYTLDN